MLPLSCEEVAGGMIAVHGNPCRCPDLHVLDLVSRKCLPCNPEQNCDAYDVTSYVNLEYTSFPSQNDVAAVFAAVGADAGCTEEQYKVIHFMIFCATVQNVRSMPLISIAQSAHLLISRATPQPKQQQHVFCTIVLHCMVAGRKRV